MEKYNARLNYFQRFIRQNILALLKIPSNVNELISILHDASKKKLISKFYSQDLVMALLA